MRGITVLVLERSSGSHLPDASTRFPNPTPAPSQYLQNLSKSYPGPYVALRGSLTLAWDEEKQEPKDHGTQTQARPVWLHRELKSLFCTTGGHAAFHQEAAQGLDQSVPRPGLEFGLGRA